MALAPLLRRLMAPAANRRGTTAIEYGLICALIAIGILGAVRGLAGLTINMWDNVGAEVKKAG